ncbi:Uncharacterized protein FKW44_012463, partial [Caligus rogercresseyi]
LIDRLQELHRLNETHLQVYLQVDQNCMEPLLIEIFDLSPKIKAPSPMMESIKSGK